MRAFVRAHALARTHTLARACGTHARTFARSDACILACARAGARSCMHAHAAQCSQNIHASTHPRTRLRGRSMCDEQYLPDMEAISCTAWPAGRYALRAMTSQSTAYTAWLLGSASDWMLVDVRRMRERKAPRRIPALPKASSSPDFYLRIMQRLREEEDLARHLMWADVGSPCPKPLRACEQIRFVPKKNPTMESHGQNKCLWLVHGSPAARQNNAMTGAALARE